MFKRLLVLFIVLYQNHLAKIGMKSPILLRCKNIVIMPTLMGSIVALVATDIVVVCIRLFCRSESIKRFQTRLNFQDDSLQRTPRTHVFYLICRKIVFAFSSLLTAALLWRFRCCFN